MAKKEWRENLKHLSKDRNLKNAPDVTQKN